MDMGPVIVLKAIFIKTTSITSFLAIHPLLRSYVSFQKSGEASRHSSVSGNDAFRFFRSFRELLNFRRRRFIMRLVGGFE